ncbi:MAG: FAD-dependent oxidoreductase [Clostridia bacterium]|nr:FAD-dependent oxidoreductase [Clostridia bacterium]
MIIKTDSMRKLEHDVDLCIVGGGMAGMIAAISAAREGVKVLLMQDRPVLGGNASSEIRMWIRGARGLHNRETGILSEIEEENIYKNPEVNHSIWDSVLWGKVKAEKNITLLLNCTCVDADTEDGVIKCVKGWQLTTYTWHVVRAKYFADCSGDSVLAPVTGALYRVGREGNAEFNETIGPRVSDKKTMGNTCLMQARETSRPVKFIPPEWAYVYENDEDFDVVVGESAKKDTDADANCGEQEKAKAKKARRTHVLGTAGTNFWWMELGGEDDTIHDAEEIRDELLKIAFGIWDHIKNRGDHNAENWELEWVGFLPGKRESRRYVGAHILTQHDIEAGGKFDDVVAHGGWPMDDHHPAGFKASSGESPTLFHPAPSPYGIPYRSLYSKNIKNLFFAGRNISVTHAALSSTRVMATCSVIGQAMGTAAAMCINLGLSPDEIYTKEIKTLQKKLLDAGMLIPGMSREIPELTLKAKCNLEPSDISLLFNGIERPDKAGTVNYVSLPKGSDITLEFEQETELTELRLMFDPDFSRKSISGNKKLKMFTLRSSREFEFDPIKVASTLVKAFEVIADGKTVYSTDMNHNSLVRINLTGIKAKRITVRFLETNGCEEIHVFSCDVR